MEKADPITGYLMTGGLPLSEDGSVLSKDTARLAIENRDKQEIISETEDEPRQLSILDMIQI